MTTTLPAQRGGPDPGPVRILAIDGGGVRGLIAARVLQEIEQRAERPIAELFDVVAGTSTGGLLALGLTVPDGGSRRSRHRAADLVDLYRDESAAIFPPWRRRLAPVRGLLGRRYPAGPLDRVLLGRFGEARLSQVLTQVVVPAYDIERRCPHFFRSRDAVAGTGTDHLLRDVARATSAAPTYFEPARVPAGPGGTRTLVDGGVFANNPAMCAYVDARTSFPDRGRFLVVSVGTGELTRPYPYPKARTWGFLRWVRPVLDIVFDGVSDAVDRQLDALCRQHPDVEDYHRFQVELDRGAKDDMDDARRGNLALLDERATELVERERTRIDALCRRLTALTPTGS